MLSTVRDTRLFAAHCETVVIGRDSLFWMQVETEFVLDAGKNRVCSGCRQRQSLFWMQVKTEFVLDAGRDRVCFGCSGCR